MNTTIAVALITALSTLSGAALASYTSLRIHRRQVGLQRETIISEQEERENERRRQLRRDAYVGLLTYCDQVGDALHECWEDKPPEQPYKKITGRLDKARRLLNSMQAPLNTVYLEGPDEILDSVANLQMAFTKTYAKLMTLANANAGIDDSLLHIALRDGDEDDIAPYHQARVEFIDAARVTLGYTALHNADVPSSPRQTA